MYQLKVRHQIFSQFPQGSILGPLLFIIYINTLPTSLHNLSCLLFADDTKCYQSIQSLSDCHLNFQSDLNHLSDWSDSISDLAFNLSKTFLLRFSSRKDKTLDFSYTIGSLPVCLVNSCKDLGIIISSDLSWSSYYNNISAKAYQTLGLIRRHFSPHITIMCQLFVHVSLTVPGPDMETQPH